MSVLDSATAQLSNGGLIILIDDLDRHEAGYICAAGETCTKDVLNSLITLSRGVVIAPISETRLKELSLHPSQLQQESLGLAVEARHGVSTGVSAADRAKTLVTLATTSRPRSDLVIPGHIFPHLSKEGGVLVRACPAEAACDLLLRAGRAPVAALARCLNDQGSSRSFKELREMAKAHSLPIISISEILCERLESESLIEEITTARLPLALMEGFSATPFRSKIDGAEHLALTLGDITSGDTPPLVRVQSEERIADLFGFGQYPTRDVMHRALQRIHQEGAGVFVYIRHPRRGVVARQVKEIGQEHANTPSRAGQLREYGIGTQILKALGIESLRLLSTSIKPMYGVENFQLQIASQVEF